MIGFGFWFVSVLVFAPGLEFCFSFLSISLKAGADDVLCCQILTREGELNTMILLAVSASKSLAFDSFTCCHLNAGGNFWFFTCTLDSNMADLIWLDSRINTG